MSVESREGRGERDPVIAGGERLLEYSLAKSGRGH